MISYGESLTCQGPVSYRDTKRVSASLLEILDHVGADGLHAEVGEDILHFLEFLKFDDEDLEDLCLQARVVLEREGAGGFSEAGRSIGVEFLSQVGKIGDSSCGGDVWDGGQLVEDGRVGSWFSVFVGIVEKPLVLVEDCRDDQGSVWVGGGGVGENFEGLEERGIG